MALGARMAELQAAMHRFEETSAANFKLVYELGVKILTGFPAYLGEGALVQGVPPQGNWAWQPNYGNAAFSAAYEGSIVVRPIAMGVGICIPHAKQDGAYCLRVMIQFEIVEDDILVFVGDGSDDIKLPLAYDERDLERIYAEIFEYTKRVFDNPVRAASAARSGKIGFLPPHAGPVVG
jgi:hypothetical protein